MKYRALVIDDEPYAREELKYLLNESELFEYAGEAGNAVEGVKQVNRLKPDIIFLDIQMPGMDGFEMVSMLDPERMPYIVFVTAYDEYALKAFEESALDYLLKPVEAERLERTAVKVEKVLSGGATPNYPEKKLEKIPCTLKNIIKIIDIKDIEYVSSDMTGVHAITPERSYLTDLTLKGIESKTDMLRTHRQFLVNKEHIDNIVINENQSADLHTKSGKTVPVSRRFLKPLKDALGI
ncbi:two-component system response regulator BtsR [Limisalsivibrio acetivorans]|uniref:two-component system response regulator BtsR n=1 Tax=Limisalsivibrio acetivorans TaxID=1304888 RepID=UPI0003B4EA5A|nr:two-component system response regulator BtsR [Limisalsivibrio acetivorans]